MYIDPSKRKPDWRTRATHEAYMTKIREGHLHEGCRLCDAISIEEFKYWRIINNDFPYDRVAKKHHMIIPLRHTNGEDITEAEQQELRELQHTRLNEEYMYMMQSLPSKMSIPSHLHYHLIVSRDFD